METQLRQLINHTISVLQHPQASPRETVIVAAMAVVLLLALLSFLSLFFVGKPKEGAAEARARVARPKPSIGLDIAVLAGALVIAVGVTMGVFSSVSSSPSYCRSCHEMGADYKSWKSSTHRTFDCANCHQDPGFFGYTLFKLRLLDMVLARASRQYSRPIRADVTNTSCLQCHESDISGALVVSGMRMRHRDVLNAGYKCVRCHNTVGHGSATVAATTPSMDECSACHDGQKVFADCARCHVVDVGRSSGAPANYPGAHLEPVTTCRGCHAVTKCNKCHGLELPHPPDWLSGYTHAPAAAFERKIVCGRCHSEVFCDQCHSGFPGHPADWKQAHGSGGPSHQQGCLGCHRGAENFCAICHPQYRGIEVTQPEGAFKEPEPPPGTKTF